MAVQMPQLKRGLFGYRPKIVRLILTGRELMYRKLWDRLAGTEAELERTRTDLAAGRHEIQEHAERARLAEVGRLRQIGETEAARAQVTELEEEVETLGARLEELEARAAEKERVSAAAEGPGSEDLSTMLASAEAAFAGMIDRARQRNEEQIREVEAARRQLQEEIGRLAAWRRDIAGLLVTVRESVTDARSEIREAPERFRAALISTTDAIGSVNDALGELADVTDRLPTVGESTEAAGIGTSLTVRIPEASDNPNGDADPGDLAAIQEQYSSHDIS